MLSFLGRRLGLLFCFTLLAISISAQQEQKKWRMRGYLRALPMLQLQRSSADVTFDHILHNRLNFRYEVNEQWRVVAETRTRLFNGNSIRHFPQMETFLNQDDGLVDLTHVLVQGEGWLLHNMTDRLYVDWQHEKWHLRLGRQRINWGINTVSNPNDLFNVYSFFDFDYVERPGADALRVKYFKDALARWELAVSPGRSWESTVVAGLYGFNYNNYDIQLIGGFFNQRFSAGGGWSGYIKSLGFKGELTFFHDLVEFPESPAYNIVASVGVDHQLKSGILLMAEYLFNQQRYTPFGEVNFLTQPLSADNLSFFEHSFFLRLSYPFSPIVNAGLAGFYYPDGGVYFLSPSADFSILQELDAQILFQLFGGERSGIFAQAPQLMALSLTWNF